VSTPAACRGYFGDPEATAELFLPDGALLTGDLGYLDAAGRLYIAGRLKNLLITGGRNLAPQEVEELVDALPFVRRSAAVGIDRGGAAGEQVYVFTELTATAARHHERFADHATEIVHRYHAELGSRPGRVYLLRPRTIPQTRNGKLKHAALRTAHLDGTLRRAGAILFPEY
jgi:fatty-acyl-CoA synthase